MSEGTLTRLPVSAIKVTERHRKDLGDLDSLAASLGELGMLQPIGVTKGGRLVFGERRLEAAKRNGWEEVPAVILDSITDVLTASKAERDENLHRKEMTKSELAAVGMAIESLEREAAKKRQAFAGKSETHKQNGTSGSGTGSHSNGDTRDKVGEAIGVGGRTYEQLKKVVTDGTPELVAAMDAGELSVKVAAQIAELPEDVQEAITSSEDVREAAAEALDRGDAWEPEDEIEDIEDDEDGDEELPQPSIDASRPLPQRKGKAPKPLDKDHPFYDVLRKFTSLNAAITKALRTEKGKALVDALREAQVGKHHLPFLFFTNDQYDRGEIKPQTVKFVGLHALRVLIRKTGDRKAKLTSGWASKTYQAALEVARTGGEKPQ